MDETHGEEQLAENEALKLYQLLKVSNVES